MHGLAGTCEEDRPVEPGSSGLRREHDNRGLRSREDRGGQGVGTGAEILRGGGTPTPKDDAVFEDW